MPKKVRWGVLGAAKIAVNKVIPAMQKGEWSEITAIASRDIHRAEKTASDLGIPKALGSYQDLLHDQDVEAIYNPLPNHLHVPWSARAAEAGKHVLCEKPIALSRAECLELMEVRDRTGVKMGEAFMVHTHPQWQRALQGVRSGEIGILRSIVSAFSYYNSDPKNIRNVPAYGGGGLMDIGCYPIHTSRFLFGEEPQRVLGLLERDPDLGVDRLTSALMDFAGGQALFTCSTQSVAYQRTQIFGTLGRIEIEIPFNAPPDRPCRIFREDGNGLRTEEFPVCDQYTIQGDLFSQAIRENREVPVPLEDALGNMAVIDALLRSAESGKWEQP